MPEPLVAVEASPWLEVVPTRQGERLIVHLVNQHGDHAVETNFRCVEQVQAVRGVQVRVQCPAPPRTITLEPGGEAVVWDWDEGCLTVEVPQVGIHRAVVLAL
jgi:hypothetical protein